MEHIAFYNGHKMPTIGLGTWQAKDDAGEEEIISAVDVALEAGYRHIDTAFLYATEVAIGKTLKKWIDSGKVKREDLFIVTKLPSWGNRANCVEKYLKKSLKALQLTYIDLYLIHHPVGLEEIEDDVVTTFFKDPKADLSTDLVSLWKAMEEQVKAGRTRSIGFSNFNSRQIKRIYKNAEIKPANIQIEVQVYCQQKELIAFCKALDITVCAFGPIGSPALKTYVKKDDVVPDLTPLTDPVVLEIANKNNRPPAQILLRHLIQKGIAIIPKSSNPKRIKENMKVFEFQLSKEDMECLDALDKGNKGRLFTDKLQPGYIGHPENPFIDAY